MLNQLLVNSIIILLRTLHRRIEAINPILDPYFIAEGLPVQEQSISAWSDVWSGLVLRETIHGYIELFEDLHSRLRIITIGNPQQSLNTL